MPSRILIIVMIYMTVIGVSGIYFDFQKKALDERRTAAIERMEKELRVISDPEVSRYVYSLLQLVQQK